jgi:hypothetical protein
MGPVQISEITFATTRELLAISALPLRCASDRASYIGWENRLEILRGTVAGTYRMGDKSEDLRELLLKIADNASGL